MPQTTPGDLQRLINRRYPGAMLMGNDPALRITRIPTGVLGLDYVLGGGLARGRHIEIFGGFNVGKTAATYRLIAMAQSLGLTCAFFDVEGTFDPSFAEHLGVDLSTLAFPQRGQNANRLIDIVETLLRSEIYDVIVIDSIAALLPKSEQDSEMEKVTMGTAQARLMSAALRKLTAANKKTVLVYINQTRESIGSMFKKSVTSGGKAMGFYAGTRLEFARIESIKKDKRRVDAKTGKEKKESVTSGHRILVRVEKDKTGGSKPFDEGTLVFDYDAKNFDPIEDLMYLGRLLDLITVSGDTWTLTEYEDEQKVGRSRFKKWLTRNTAVAEELEETIREAIGAPE